MEDETARKTRGRTKALVSGLGAAGVLIGLPAVAWAAPAEAAEPPVAIYTATAIAAVILVAALATLALKLVRGFRLIDSEKHAHIGRRLRVSFGALFLMATVTPYVALNFSSAVLVPFIAGSGLVVAAWVWGASATEFDAEPTPSRPDGV